MPKALPSWCCKCLPVSKIEPAVTLRFHPENQHFTQIDVKFVDSHFQSPMARDGRVCFWGPPPPSKKNKQWCLVRFPFKHAKLHGAVFQVNSGAFSSPARVTKDSSRTITCQTSSMVSGIASMMSSIGATPELRYQEVNAGVSSVGI